MKFGSKKGDRIRGFNVRKMATILAKRLGGKVQIKKILAILSTPLQYSCLENPMDGGAWQATIHGVTKSQT